MAATAYEVNAKLARQAERRGDALAAAVRWSLAAHASEHEVERIGALAAAARNAELALHQAVYASQRQHHYDDEQEEAHESPRHDRGRPSWRALASATGLPPSTLNRRYRHKPARMPPRPLDLHREDVERLMGADRPPLKPGRPPREPGLS